MPIYSLRLENTLLKFWVSFLVAEYKYGIVLEKCHQTRNICTNSLLYRNTLFTIILSGLPSGVIATKVQFLGSPFLCLNKLNLHLFEIVSNRTRFSGNVKMVLHLYCIKRKWWARKVMGRFSFSFSVYWSNCSSASGCRMSSAKVLIWIVLISNVQYFMSHWLRPLTNSDSQVLFCFFIKTVSYHVVMVM